MLKQLIHGLRIYTESVKVQITSAQDYTYPDVLVAPDPRDLESTYIKKYPSVIFEVISKTTHIDDAADKFIRYKNIDSLQNYILVDSENIFIEVRAKQDNGEWLSEIYLSANARFPIPALGVELEISGVYEGIFLVPSQLVPSPKSVDYTPSGAASTYVRHTHGTLYRPGTWN
jgi:Uma2 family endonuclease